MNETGIEIEPGPFGDDALGSDVLGADRGPFETEKPRTGGPAARADVPGRALLAGRRGGR